MKSKLTNKLLFISVMAAIPYLAACADNSNETDGGTQNPLIQAPDLLLEPVSPPTTAIAGEDITITIKVTNQGQASASGSILRYYSYTGAAGDLPSSGTEIENSVDTISSLAVDEESEQSVTFTAPAAAETYNYGACVVTTSDESDTNNNCTAAITIMVTAAVLPVLLQPDLVLEAVSPPTTAVTGEDITITIKVTNQGQAAASGSILRYYSYSGAADILPSSGTEISNTVDTISSLAVDEESEQSVTFTAPAAAETYNYGACVVTTSDESDITNNCTAAITIMVTAAVLPVLPQPDLVLESVSPPTTATAGEDITITIKVTNQGQAAASGSILRYYSYSGAADILPSSGTEISNTVDTISSLAAAGESEQSVTFTAPEAAASPYNYGACVVTTGESVTTNNCTAAIPITVTAAVLLQPDLSLELGSSPASVMTGEDITITIKVTNQGQGNASNAALRYYSYSGTGLPSSGTEIENSSDTIGLLAANGETERFIIFSAPETAGAYNYGACVEAAGESDTNNNCTAAIPIMVVNPPQVDLILELVSAPTTAATGESIDIVFKVENQGEVDAEATTLSYYISFDADISSSDDTEIESVEISALAAGDSENAEAVFPTLSATGPYYYGACVPPQTGETVTDNNCVSTMVTVQEPVKVISFNIRYNNPPKPGVDNGDGNNQWSLRRDSVIAFLKYEKADFMGMQEALYSQLQYLKTNLTQYSSFEGQGRDGNTDGTGETEYDGGEEFNPIYYLKDKWELLESDTFWLSPTPNVVSKGWQPGGRGLNRICNWAKFRNKTTMEEIFVFNAHYTYFGDSAGATVRLQSTNLILERMAGISNNANSIVIGDLNATPDETSITTFANSQHLQDSFTSVGSIHGSEPTITRAFQFDFDDDQPTKRIDYVFASTDMDVIDYSTDSSLLFTTDSSTGRYLSDHFPVIVRLKKKEPMALPALDDNTPIEAVQPVKVISYNTHHPNDTHSCATNRTTRNWTCRREAAWKFIAYENADFVGLQEAEMSQSTYLKGNLNQYEWFGKGGEAGNTGEGNPIFYLSARWKRLDSGTFWLASAATMNMVSRYVEGSNRANYRTCTWGSFEHKITKQKFFVFNTQWQGNNDGAATFAGRSRQRAYDIILAQMMSVAEAQGETALTSSVLMGYLGPEPTNVIIQSIANNAKFDDTYTTAALKYGHESTITRMDTRTRPKSNERLDYIFTTSDYQAVKYNTENHLIKRRYLTDHYPLVVYLEKK